MLLSQVCFAAEAAKLARLNDIGKGEHVFAFLSRCWFITFGFLRLKKNQTKHMIIGKSYKSVDF
jgi:hypothetical protein